MYSNIISATQRQHLTGFQIYFVPLQFDDGKAAVYSGEFNADDIREFIETEQLPLFCVPEAMVHSTTHLKCIRTTLLRGQQLLCICKAYA